MFIHACCVHVSLLSIFVRSSRIQRKFRKVFEGFVRERVNRSPVVEIDTLHVRFITRRPF